MATIRRRRRLVDSLREDGALSDPRWVQAFRAVPRQLFLPRFFVADGDRWAAVQAGDDGWLDHVYRDRVLVTQLDDSPERWEVARAEGPVIGVPTCSSSMPSIMAIMLEELRVREGDRVLEIGTGTGYNAALLCARLGDANVSTVDIDPALVSSARAALRAVGYAPACQASDGALGLPAEAPFDRVLCTCAVSPIPPAWLAQTRPGGLVVTTLHRPIGAGLVRLVAGEGARGEGRVLARDGRFMPMRAHRKPASLPAARESEARTTSLPVSEVTDPSSPFEFFAGLALAGVTPRHDAGSVTFTHPDGSWATRTGNTVDQGGPRRLWDDVERAREEWKALGKPTRRRFGVTVSPRRQSFWLDRPDGPTWPLDG
ncbi:ATP-grasp peptide maturase system methyltransferase [Amycolatopsis sp. CA-230715]|uniref:ATP-grasp peptide maturase system methyltransferase n=1 Tax=Amycolatopsis sp. CA-230715 TaxID=2745196 RepID=UPI001C01B93D|nr:ATP-grasp peptide maturase system methyltransferase [Amycolatopsis sp. CA-230715]QWF79943.1 Protein-L-isoaspartate O-methyltransferase [Amycolatopsis sp. CA-230715]